MTKNSRANKEGQGASAPNTKSVITSVPIEKLTAIDVATAMAVGIVPRKASSIQAMVRTKMIRPAELPKLAPKIKSLTFPVYVFKFHQSYSESAKYLIIDSMGQVVTHNIPINHPKVQQILKAILEYES